MVSRFLVVSTATKCCVSEQAAVLLPLPLRKEFSTYDEKAMLRYVKESLIAKKVKSNMRDTRTGRVPISRRVMSRVLTRRVDDA